MSLNPRRGRKSEWTVRPRLTEADLIELERLRQGGEGTVDAIRRLVREALERKPMDEALRAIEQRLSSIEAAGVRAVVSSETTRNEPQDVLTRQAAALAGFLEDE